MYRNLKNILKELHLILACDQENQNIFPIPATSFKDNKTFTVALSRKCSSGYSRWEALAPVEERNLINSYAIVRKILIILRASVSR